MTPDSLATSPEKEIDLFLTLRYISPSGKEVFYTGTAGDPVPLTKGWLRASLRKIASEHPRNSPYQPYREYRSTDVQEVKPDTVYAVDVEIWPTNVVAEKGGRIVLEVSSGDTQGSGIFTHTSEVDRYVDIFLCLNGLGFADIFLGRRRSSRGRTVCILGRGWRIMLRCRLFLQDRQGRMNCIWRYASLRFLMTTRIVDLPIVGTRVMIKRFLRIFSHHVDCYLGIFLHSTHACVGKRKTTRLQKSEKMTSTSKDSYSNRDIQLLSPTHSS